jgi:E3 ubiquitin-protein ligase TRIP12
MSSALPRAAAFAAWRRCRRTRASSEPQSRPCRPSIEAWVALLPLAAQVGTGLGPTLEFFTLLSHDLQKKCLGMWRHEDAAVIKPEGGDAMQVDGDDGGAAASAAADAAASAAATGVPAAPAGSRPGGGGDWHDPSEYVHAPFGLFPAPLSPSARSTAKAVEHFRLLGRSVAKALQDSRLMDLPLSPAFYRAALGRRLDLIDISGFDPHLGASLQVRPSGSAY